MDGGSSEDQDTAVESPTGNYVSSDSFTLASTSPASSLTADSPSKPKTPWTPPSEIRGNQRATQIPSPPPGQARAARSPRRHSIPEQFPWKPTSVTRVLPVNRQGLGYFQVEAASSRAAGVTPSSQDALGASGIPLSDGLMQEPCGPCISSHHIPQASCAPSTQRMASYSAFRPNGYEQESQTPQHGYSSAVAMTTVPAVYGYIPAGLSQIPTQTGGYTYPVPNSTMYPTANAVPYSMGQTGQPFPDLSIFPNFGVPLVNTGSIPFTGFNALGQIIGTTFFLIPRGNDGVGVDNAPSVFPSGVPPQIQSVGPASQSQFGAYSTQNAEPSPLSNLTQQTRPSVTQPYPGVTPGSQAGNLRFVMELQKKGNDEHSTLTAIDTQTGTAIVAGEGAVGLREPGNQGVASNHLPPTADVGSTQQPPTTDIGSTQYPPSVDTVLTQKRPIADFGSTQQRPPTEVGSTQEPPTVDSGSTQQPRTSVAGSTQKRPSANIGSTQQQPTIDVGLTQQPPTADTGSTKYPPSVDIGWTQYPPTADIGSTQQPPTADTGSTQKRPIADFGSTQQRPPTEVGSTQEPPVVDSGSTQQPRTSVTGSTQKRPSADIGSTQQQPTIDVGSTQQPPTVDSSSTQQSPSVESVSTQQPRTSDANDTVLAAMDPTSGRLLVVGHPSIAPVSFERTFTMNNDDSDVEKIHPADNQAGDSMQAVGNKNLKVEVEKEQMIVEEMDIEDARRLQQILNDGKSIKEAKKVLNDEKSRKAEEEKRRKAEEEEKRRKVEEEEKRRKAEEEKRRKAEEEKRRKMEEEKRRKMEEEKRRKMEEEKRRKAEEEKRRKAEEEKRRKMEEEKRRKMEGERRRKAEEENRRKMEEEKRRKLEEKNKRKMEEEKKKKMDRAMRRQAEEEKRKKMEEERRKAEEERRRQANRRRDEEMRRANNLRKTKEASSQTWVGPEKSCDADECDKWLGRHPVSTTSERQKAKCKPWGRCQVSGSPLSGLSFNKKKKSANLKSATIGNKDSANLSVKNKSSKAEVNSIYARQMGKDTMQLRRPVRPESTMGLEQTSFGNGNPPSK